MSKAIVCPFINRLPPAMDWFLMLADAVEAYSKSLAFQQINSILGPHAHFTLGNYKSETF